MKFERITIDPAVCTGKPCIRGLRFPVSRLLGLLASGESREGTVRCRPTMTGFDGRTSVSEAVRADLIFLRRTYSGQFLLIDQQVGILGRDILNHVSLLLDGPRLIWEEQH